MFSLKLYRHIPRNPTGNSGLQEISRQRDMLGRKSYSASITTPEKRRDLKTEVRRGAYDGAVEASFSDIKYNVITNTNPVQSERGESDTIRSHTGVVD
jgi:hypothetical protein